MHTLNKFKLHFILVIILSWILITGCTKLVEVNGPGTSLNGDNIYENDQTAIAVLTSVYTKISQGSIADGTIASLSLYTSLAADELSLFDGVTNDTYLRYYRNELTANSQSGNEFFWNSFYPMIFTINSAIEGITASASLTPAVKKQLLGEAKFMRGFCYFYLVNLYGKVPLVLSTNYQMNASLPRSAEDSVWNQVIADLTEAKTLLKSEFLDGGLINSGGERIRPTKWAAGALLARSYLTLGEYALAEQEATAIIDNAQMFALNSLDDVFLKNSTESIWQLQPVNAGQNTQDAMFFVIPETGIDPVLHPAYAGNHLVAAFETGDDRKTHWLGVDNSTSTGYYYPYKYKVAIADQPVTEYLTVLRLAEQYLLRAEARAQQENVSGAIADINIIRARARNSAPGSLPDLDPGLSRIEALNAVAHERQVELFAEWGHRWLDIKRLKSSDGETPVADVIMPPVTAGKGGSWQTTDKLFPVPVSELLANPNMTQTAGY